MKRRHRLLPGIASDPPLIHARLVKTFSEIAADYESIFLNDRSPDNTRGLRAEIAPNDSQDRFESLGVDVF